MRDTIGILYANSDGDQLQGLAQYRPIAAVPFEGAIACSISLYQTWSTPV